VRITFIIDHYVNQQGGTENQLAKIIHGLKDRFELELISLRSSAWLATEGHRLACPLSVHQVDRFKRAYSYRNIGRLIGQLRATRPDIVHTFFPVSNIIGVLAARAAKVPVVVASRRDYGEWMRWHYLLMTRVANRFVDRIVTNSNQVKQLTEQRERFPGARIAVIYNGIDVEAFRGLAPDVALKRALGIAQGKKLVGLIANYRPMKRHETFVQAAHEIVRCRDDVDFLLVGRNAVPGDPKGRIRQMVASLGMASRVHFAEALGNVRNYLSILDVGVNCSEGEGLSNAIMEYMAAGIPCVVADSGGNPDLITDDVSGYTFAPGDHHALARKILRLLDEEDTRQRLAATALEKVRREMSLESMIDRFGRFYQELLESQATAAKAPN
jgi:glycosyltransferase involved in cell wall biosynthesis